MKRQFKAGVSVTVSNGKEKGVISIAICVTALSIPEKNYETYYSYFKDQKNSEEEYIRAALRRSLDSISEIFGDSYGDHIGSKEWIENALRFKLLFPLTNDLERVGLNAPEISIRSTAVRYIIRNIKGGE